MTRLYIYTLTPYAFPPLCLAAVHFYTQSLQLPSYAAKCPLPCLYTYHTQSPFICNDDNDDDADNDKCKNRQERDRDVQGWALVCDTLLTRAASPGTVFQVRVMMTMMMMMMMALSFGSSQDDHDYDC